MNKKHISVSILLVIILAFGIGNVMISKKNEVPHENGQKVEEQHKEQQTAAEDKDANDTNTWKAYQNEKIGFGIKVPDDLLIEECPSHIGVSKKPGDIHGCSEGSLIATPIIIFKDHYSATHPTAEGYLDLENKFYKENFNNFTSQKIRVNDLSAYKFTGIARSSGKKRFLREEDVNTQITSILLPTTDHVMRFELYYRNIDNGSEKEYERVLEKIVSTFFVIENSQH